MSTLQQGSKGATSAFNRFVEGGSDDRAAAGGYTNPNRVQPDADKRDFWDSFSAVSEERVAPKKKVEPERKDFWDEFADAGAKKTAGGAGVGAAKAKSSIGTAAMRKTNGGSAGGGEGKKEGEWEEW